MFLINLNAEIVAYILSLRKLRQKPNLENTSKYGFSPDLGGKNGGVLSMRMQVILDSSSHARVQPLHGAGRKESSGTGLSVFPIADQGLVQKFSYASNKA